MSELNLILQALATGANAALQQTSGTAIKDAYSGLKTLIERRFANQPKAREALTDYVNEPDIYERPLGKFLRADSLDQDKEIIAAAHHLVSLLQSQQIGLGKYTIQNTSTVQGQIIGDNPTVTQHFGIQSNAEIALENQREELLRDYMERIVELLTTHPLRTTNEIDEIRRIARIQTLTILDQQLDPIRKGKVLLFLYKSSLLSRNQPLISLANVDLREAHLSYANLSEADLSGAGLCYADLSYANLSRANLKGTDLRATLNGANLSRAKFSRTLMP